jgi:hypothetical protein
MGALHFTPCVFSVYPQTGFGSAHAVNPHFSHAQLRGGFELMAVRAAVVYWRQRESGEIF